jgi:type II secretory pathway pseudopilin PulG
MYHNQKTRAAFTIVELLVAATITVLIVVMLGTMFGSLTHTAARANESIDAFRDARAALQMIKRDLTNVITTQWQQSPNPPNTTQPVTRLSAYLVLDNVWKDLTTDPYSDATNPYYNHQIYALIAAKNSGTGDLCSVGYYCRWDDQLHTYTLRRFFRDSVATYNVFVGPAVTGANYAAETDLYTPDAPGTASNLLKDEVLASNVWDLKITAYDNSGTVINSQTNNNIITTKPPYICDPQSATAPNPLPASIEISFKAMSSQAAHTIMNVSNNPKDWMEPTSRNKLLVNPNAHEFRTRIDL